MDFSERIRIKIENIEKLLAEVKTELEVMSREAKSRPKKAAKAESLPPENELHAEYEKLYSEFAVRNSKAIEEFIKDKTKDYLRVFCKANNLPVDTTKVSKNNIAKEVMQWMAQRKAIIKKAI